MLHTTFRKAKEMGACSSEYNKMARFLGGVNKYGEDTPIPLDKILDVCGLDAALWCLCCVIEPADREIRLLACDFAEHTLPIFEKKYPNNKQPRQTIEISRRFAEGKATQEELDTATVAVWAATWAARDAAWDAEDAAWAAREAAMDARNAAEDAAWDARNAAGNMRDAERQWQEQKFREMLNNSGN